MKVILSLIKIFATSYPYPSCLPIFHFHVASTKHPSLVYIYSLSIHTDYCFPSVVGLGWSETGSHVRARR